VIEVTVRAREAVTEILAQYLRTMLQTDLERLADRLIVVAITEMSDQLRAAVHAERSGPQAEMDAEYMASLQAQRRAAEIQAEHSHRLVDLVERSEELTTLQIELTRRQLDEMDRT
jgi:hypothetical protein